MCDILLWAGESLGSLAGTLNLDGQENTKNREKKSTINCAQHANHIFFIETQEKVMHRLFSGNQRGFAVYTHINCRLVAHLLNEKCKSKHKFLGRATTDEQFAQIVKDKNSGLFLCWYWLAEGIFQYYGRWAHEEVKHWYYY